MLNDILQALQALLFDFTGELALIILGFAAYQFKRWTGIQIEDKHMRALHSAIMSGIQLAADKKLTKDLVVTEVMAYVRQSVPDALRALVGNKDGLLAKLILAKLNALGK